MGRRILGVDDHIDADLPLEEVGLLVVLRAADTGHGVAGPQLFGDQAADDIQLIGAGDCHHQIRRPDAGLQQDLDGGAAALHTQDVQCAVGISQRLEILVDEHQIVVLSAELAGQGVAHLAVADNDDLHVSLSLQGPASRSPSVVPDLAADFRRRRSPPRVSRVLFNSAPRIRTVAVR